MELAKLLNYVKKERQKDKCDSVLGGWESITGISR